MIFAIDVGGTNTRIALIDASHIIDRVVFETQQDIEMQMSIVYTKALEIAAGRPVERAIIGLPGVTKEDGMLLASHNLQGWEGHNIKELFFDALAVPTFIINDAELAALGEATYGAGKDHHIVVYMTISTGIGGTRIVDKIFDTALSGFEPGQQIIDYKEMLTLQDLASGAAVKKETGLSPREVTDEGYWQDKAKILAVGIWNSVVHWSPQVIVLNGPMILRKPGIDIHDVQVELERIAAGTMPLPDLLLAELHDDAALYGATAYNDLLASA